MKKLLTVIALGLVSFTANADDSVISSYKAADIDVIALRTSQLLQLNSDRQNYQWTLELENNRHIDAVLASK